MKSIKSQVNLVALYFTAQQYDIEQFTHCSCYFYVTWYKTLCIELNKIGEKKDSGRFYNNMTESCAVVGI